jgi:uncharacterized protein (DUF983 family)
MISRSTTKDCSRSLQKEIAMKSGNIIEVLIVIIVAGAIWYLFQMFATMVGLPGWVIQVVGVLAVVVVAVYVLRFLGSLLKGGPSP